MNYRNLGNTGIRVSEMGFGGWGLGGEAYGPVDQSTSKRTLEVAFDLGINFFDTSDLYGSGRSETLIGETFARRRSEVVIASKGGTLPHGGFHMPQDFSSVHLRLALEASLRRLCTNYIDLYQLHSPTLADVQGQDAVGTLMDFQREGLIRCIGISARSPQDALWFVENTPVSVIQVNFNLIDQRAVDCGLFKAAARKGVGLVARTPLCFGYLTGKFSGLESYSKGDHRANWPVEQLRRWASAPGLFDELIASTGLTPAQFALRFCLDHPEVGTVIPGFLTPEHVRENIGAVAASGLPAGCLAEARRIYRTNTFYDPGIKPRAILQERSTQPLAA